MAKYVKVEKGLEAVRHFAITGYWETGETLVEDVGYPLSFLGKLYWETGEECPIEVDEELLGNCTPISVGAVINGILHMTTVHSYQVHHSALDESVRFVKEEEYLNATS